MMLICRNAKSITWSTSTGEPENIPKIKKKYGKKAVSFGYSMKYHIPKREMEVIWPELPLRIFGQFLPLTEILIWRMLHKGSFQGIQTVSLVSFFIFIIILKKKECEFSHSFFSASTSCKYNNQMFGITAFSIDAIKSLIYQNIVCDIALWS